MLEGMNISIDTNNPLIAWTLEGAPTGDIPQVVLDEMKWLVGRSPGALSPCARTIMYILHKFGDKSGGELREVLLKAYSETVVSSALTVLKVSGRISRYRLKNKHYVWCTVE